MKTKEFISPSPFPSSKLNGVKEKTKSLRPMPSLSAVRSLKPRTMVANLIEKKESDSKNS